MRPHRFFAYGTLGSGLFLLTSLAFLTGGTGCYGDQCNEPAVIDFGNLPGEGRFIPPDTWESRPLDSPDWLHYPAKQTYRFWLHGLEGRRIYAPEAQIAVMRDPNAPNKEGEDRRRFAPLGGNLAEYHIEEHGKAGKAPVMTVRNDTCGEYYLYVRVRAEPAPPSIDAGGASLGPRPTDSSRDATNDTGATE
ncbi:hypothetical protein [Pendulispora albinea]|uniref:Uncharacterized protein n=1 Tax=Pendulispora albinea TaxID=2741071 RepID=A0ABZ2M2Z4_9BACT